MSFVPCGLTLGVEMDLLNFAVVFGLETIARPEGTRGMMASWADRSGGGGGGGCGEESWSGGCGGGGGWAGLTSTEDAVGWR